jgi:putative ABC transport system permease protein
MEWLNELGRRLRTLFLRDHFDRELDEEMRLHMELRAEQQAARGVNPADARAAAHRQFGNATRMYERSREAWGWVWLEQLVQDVSFGTRNMMRAPGFTAVTILTLAIGIGTTTAIFSAVNPILFASLPYPHPGQIVMISDLDGNGSRLDLTFHTYRELLQRSRSFESAAVIKPWQPTLVGAIQPERLDGQRVTAAFFRALGVSPAMGKDFDAGDDRLNGPNVVILSDGLWRRRFAADGAIVGREVRLDDNLYTVIGVMPRNFENVLSPSAEVWSLLQYDSRNIASVETREWGHHLRMLARLRPDVSRDQALRELDAIAHDPVKDFPRAPWAVLDRGLLVNSLQEDIAWAVRPALLAVFGAVMLVLLIACINVTNLLLARGAQRRGEFAMRVALGAGRTRLTRQLLTESLLLAAVGCALGLLAAEMGVRALVALSPPELPRLSAITVNGPVFAFAFAITTLIALLVGLVPAWQAARADLHFGLKESASRSGGHHATRRTLVAAEVSLALVLLVSAGLLLRSLQRLFAVAPGFDPSHLLTMQVLESGHRFDDDAARYRFFAQALGAVQQVPGVESAAFSSQLPLSGDLEIYGIEFEKDIKPVGDHSGFRYAVTPGYCATMNIPLRRGRLLTERDLTQSPTSVLISESLANRRFPGRDPIGQRLRVGPDIGRSDRPWSTIVGVVGDVKQASLALSESDAVYIPTTRWVPVDTVQSLVVRTRGDAAALAPLIRNVIWSVDKDQPIVRVASMDALVAESAAQRRFAMILFEAFGLVALALAATGIYGLVSGSVTERTREIGVRAALGATRARIVALVLRQGMLLTATGVVIGLAGAAAASEAIEAMLFGVSRLDPETYIGVVAVLLIVSAAACWVPAWRAARIDPAITLRTE